MLPVLTLLSAAWFAAAVVAGSMLWQRTGHGGYPWPSHWGAGTHWIPLVALLIIFLLVALPLSAGRRAALVAVNGGRRHGWANAWAGLLWFATAAILLIAAWLALPPLQDLTHELWRWPLPRFHTIWT